MIICDKCKADMSQTTYMKTIGDLIYDLCDKCMSEWQTALNELKLRHNAKLRKDMEKLHEEFYKFAEIKK